MYSCSFWYVLVFCIFLSFFALAFVAFLLLHKDAIFMLSHFFLTIGVSHEILHLALGLIDMHSAATSL